MSDTTSRQTVLDNNEHQSNDVTISMTGDLLQEDQAPKPLIRHDMVATAVSFLLNPQIKSNPLEKKRSFLVNKGLTINEINTAFDWAEKGLPYYPSINQHQPQHILTIHQQPHMAPAVYNGNIPWQQTPGVWMLTKALLPSMAILAGIAYTIYLFYKHYIESWFFGSQKPKQKHPLVVVTENVDKLTQSVEALKHSLETFEQGIKRSMEESVGKVIMEVTSRRPPASGSASSEDVAAVKKEVQSLKALLLSRNQFPESPVLSIVHQKYTGSNEANGNGSSPPMTQSPPPSIPSWQLTDELKEEELKEKH